LPRIVNILVLKTDTDFPKPGTVLLHGVVAVGDAGNGLEAALFPADSRPAGTQVKTDRYSNPRRLAPGVAD
jgi:hypothetical protein